jgi:HlyD family secretion protein
MTRRTIWKVSARTALLVALLLVLAAVVAYGVAWRPTPIPTVRVHEGQVEETLHGLGTVQTRVPVTVSTRTTGTVVQLYADQGDIVRRGQRLALLDARELVARETTARRAVDIAHANVNAAEAALAQARASTALARSNYQRDLEVFGKHYISPAAMDATTAALRVAESAEQNAVAALAGRRAEVSGAEAELEYAGVLVSYARIDAPFDGVIWRRDAEIGDTLVPGNPIFRILSPSTIWSATRIDDTVAGRLAVGQRATVRLRSGEEIQGAVVRLEHESDVATRESIVDVSLPAHPRDFRIGEETDVVIHVGTSRGLLVPASAVVQRNGGPGVFVIENGRARFRRVTVGASAAGTVLVATGLEDREVVAAGPAALRDGQRVVARPGN